MLDERRRHAAQALRAAGVRPRRVRSHGVEAWRIAVETLRTGVDALRAAAIRPRLWRWHVLVTALWAAASVTGAVGDPPPGLRQVALPVHVLGLTIGLGAVLLLDWYGLLWLGGRRRFLEVVRLAEAAHPMIWAGILLLVCSGALLHWDPANGTAWLKQGLVLLLLNNGVALRSTSSLLRGIFPRPDDLRALAPRIRARVLVSLGVSQVGWWGATVIGFLTTGHRHP